MSNHRREFLLRAVFRLTDGSGGDHHYTLVTDPGHSSGNCVILNWTTRKHLAREDTSCILNRLDHPAITVESLVHYNKAGLVSAAGLQKHIVAGLFGISDVLLNEAAYKRVMLGFQVTKHVPPQVYEFLDGAGFLPCQNAPGCWAQEWQGEQTAACSFALCRPLGACGNPA